MEKHGQGMEWEKPNFAMADICTHKTLMFGSGDYYLFCMGCDAHWVMCGNDDLPAPELSNKGAASTLSGKFRMTQAIPEMPDEIYVKFIGSETENGLRHGTFTDKFVEGWPSPQFKFIRASVYRDQARELESRITNYLINGGRFDPEAPEYVTLRNIILDARAFLRQIAGAPQDQER